MITIRDNPVEVVCGEVVTPACAHNPLHHIKMAVASCLAKHMRNVYLLNDIEPCIIEVDFVNDVIIIVVRCVDCNFDEYLGIIRKVVDRCYVLNHLNFPVDLKIISETKSHGFVCEKP